MLMQPVPTKLGRASVTTAQPHTLITKPTGFIAQYDGVINPYIGCTFGCDYCYAANFAQDQKLQDSWGLWVKAKTNALHQMAKIPAGKLNGQVLYISTATDPYQPLERTVQTTRGLLEIMALQHPRVKLVIQTRSPLVTRDLDLFQQIQEQGGRVQVNMTVTTDSDPVRRLFEPGCPTSAARLHAIANVQETVQGCITMTPLLPLENAESFAAQLLATGVKRFIVQEFHLDAQQGRRFIAGTDAKALEHLKEHYGATLERAKAQYKQEYRNAREVLKQQLPQLGEGRPGFAPPF